MMLGLLAVRAPVRFMLSLLAIDVAIVAGVGAVAGRPAATTTVATAERADAQPAANKVAPLWRSVDPAALGEKAAGVYLAARRRLAKNKRVILAAPRRVGDDVEIRVSLARLLADGKTGQGFPPGMYCFHCPMQRCTFPEATLEAFTTVAEAFRPEEVRELARVAGTDHVEVAYVGGASAGPVVPKAESQSCEGLTPRTDIRVPPAFDIYDDGECGAHRCEMLGSGESIEVGDGFIDDNKKLACLRALCTSAAAGGMGDLPVKFVGDLAFEAGGAYRGAEVVVTLKGVGSAENKDAYGAFWNRMTTLIAEEK